MWRDEILFSTSTYTLKCTACSSLNGVKWLWCFATDLFKFAVLTTTTCAPTVVVRFSKLLTGSVTLLLAVSGLHQLVKPVCIMKFLQIVVTAERNFIQEVCIDMNWYAQADPKVAHFDHTFFVCDGALSHPIHKWTKFSKTSWTCRNFEKKSHGPGRSGP
jgi:hypothetical protein